MTIVKREERKRKAEVHELLDDGELKLAPSFETYCERMSKKESIGHGQRSVEFLAFVLFLFSFHAETTKYNVSLRSIYLNDSFRIHFVAH